MPSKFVPDNTSADDWVDGVDRHYYENQVPPSGPFHDTSFEFAAAVAKDRARHKLIRAVQKENDRLLYERGRFEEIEDVLAGGGTSIGDRTSQAEKNVKRSINGVEGAPDDAIKL